MKITDGENKSWYTYLHFDSNIFLQKLCVHQHLHSNIFFANPYTHVHNYTLPNIFLKSDVLDRTLTFKMIKLALSFLFQHHPKPMGDDLFINFQIDVFAVCWDSFHSRSVYLVIPSSKAFDSCTSHMPTNSLVI